MKIIKRPDPERLHVLAAQLRLWLLDVCVWLSAWLGVKLPREMRVEMRADIREALFGARLLIFLLAMSRRERTSLRVYTERPPSTPPGFRWNRDTTNPFRRFKRAVRLHGRSITARIGELRDMLGNLDRWVKRMIAHLDHGPHGARLVLCAALACALPAFATPTPLGADTS